MKLYQGRPKTAEGREKKEMKVYDLLDSLDIDYVRADHEAVMTIEACKEVDEALEIEICKNLFLCNRQKTAFYLLVLPGGKSLQTKESLRCLQRLSLPDLATLPCRWSTTDTPVVRPSRSSRTKDSSSQISSARAG